MVLFPLQKRPGCLLQETRYFFIHGQVNIFKSQPVHVTDCRSSRSVKTNHFVKTKLRASDPSNKISDERVEMNEGHLANGYIIATTEGNNSRKGA